MDGQYRRLLLQALFSPSSAALGRALRQLPVDADPGDFAARLPKGLKSRATLLNGAPQLERFHHTLREQGWRWVALGDDDYPELLANIPDAPGVLAVRGEVSALHAPALAMVGARSASADGLDNSRRFSRQLAGSGFAIVSGLALGVDAAAHQGALATGRTVAVMASGPERIYPTRHGRLAEQILDHGGALVTEFAPGTQPLAKQFPQRNRIISGLSLATIVVEAAIRSGSLITARTALAQGREVFAIPGSIHNPLSKGCHKLLREGASWLESVDDIFAAFGDFQRSIEAAGVTAEAAVPPLLAHFTSGLNGLDGLQQRSGLPVQELTGLLADLELDGWVERVAGGYLKRAAAPQGG